MKTTEREDVIRRIENVLQLTHKKSLTVTIPKITAELVVSMLKDHEAVEPKNVRKSSSHAYSGLLLWYCPKCGIKINSSDNLSACGKCGQAVKWND